MPHSMQMIILQGVVFRLSEFLAGMPTGHVGQFINLCSVTEHTTIPPNALKSIQAILK
jgi:hypothetical protein